MNRAQENECFARFGETRDPRLLAQVFDATATELLQVAGHLCNGDRDQAQEVLQATFLTAMENATSYDSTRDLRPWLLGILANHVRKERRRTLRHRGADADELGLVAKDSPVEEAQEAELGEATLAAMQRLSQPLREPLVLHLRHGLTAQEIGVALDRPPATVRVQIQRGMQRLRELLPAGFAAAALGATLAPSTVLAAVRRDLLATLPTVGSSSLLLSSWRLYAMIGMAASVVLSVLFLVFGGDEPAPPVTSLEAAEPPPANVERVSDTATRRAVESNEPDRPATESTDAEPAVPANHVPVEFEVVYASDGAKAAGVPIGVRLDGEVRRWRTDDDGVVKMALPYPGAHEVWVLGTYAKHLLMWPGVGRRPQKQRHTLKIPAGLTLDVHVVDADGNPIAGASIESSHGFRATDQFTVLGQTDVDGRYVHRDLSTTGQLRAIRSGFVPSALTTGDGAAGKTKVVELRLPKRGLQVRGIVCDETGAPLGNAELALVQFRSRVYAPHFFTSDDNGVFTIDTLHAGNHMIVGRHRGKHERRGLVRFARAAGDSDELRLQLTTGGRVVGRIAEPPTRTAQVIHATYLPDCVHDVPFVNPRTAVNAAGTFELTGLIPGRYRLHGAKLEDRVVTIRGNEAIEWNPTPIVEVATAARLLDHNGDPLVGWRISLIPEGALAPTRSKLTVAGGVLMHTDSSPWLLPQGTTCRFAVHRCDGTFHTKTLAAMVTEPLPVGQVHEIRLPGYAATTHEITATVVGADGQPIPDAKVLLEGDHGIVRMQALAEAGRFRAEEQPPGEFRLLVDEPGSSYYRGPRIKVGDTPLTDVGRVVVPSRSRLTVRLPDGETHPGLTVQVVGNRGRAITLRNKGGAWRSHAMYHGDYEVRGWSKTHRIVPTKIALSAENDEVEIRLQPHAVSEVTVLLPADNRRNTPSWVGTVAAYENDRLVFEQRVRHPFRGTFTDRLQFGLSLPPGKLEVRVTSLHKRTGKARLHVPPAGGGKVTVTVQ